MTAGPDRKQIDLILAERARRLARPLAEAADAPAAELVAFSTGSERYAVATDAIYRVERIQRTAPLPDAAPHFAGITNLHGQLVPLVDVGLLLASAPCDDPGFAVVLGGTRPDIGLRAQSLLDIFSLPLELLRRPAGARGIVHHITADGIAVLDAAALLADRRLTHEEALL